jgi:hypothetical protein
MLTTIEQLSNKLREETLKSECFYFRTAVLDTISKITNVIDSYGSLEADIDYSIFSKGKLNKIILMIINEEYDKFHSFCKERELYYKERFHNKPKYNTKDLIFRKEHLVKKLDYNQCLIIIMLEQEDNEITELISQFYSGDFYTVKREIEVSLNDLFSPDDRTYIGGYADNHFYHLFNESILLNKILLAN